MVVTHESIAHYMDVVGRDVLGPDATRMPLFTAAAFDLTLTTLFAPLCSGGQITIVPPCHSADALDAVVGPAATATAVKLTPSHIAMLAARPAAVSTLSVAIVGGEALTADHIATLRSHAPAVRVINEYGPTETTVGVIAGEVTPTRRAHRSALPQRARVRARRGAATMSDRGDGRVVHSGDRPRARLLAAPWTDC